MRWVRLFKTKLSSILMRLKSLQIKLFHTPAKPSKITKTLFLTKFAPAGTSTKRQFMFLFNNICPRRDINKTTNRYVSQRLPQQSQQKTTIREFRLKRFLVTFFPWLQLLFSRLGIFQGSLGQEKVPDYPARSSRLPSSYNLVARSRW